MGRLYPPITEEALSAFCLSYNDKGEKIGAQLKIDFNLNRAVANTEISGMALRLRTISTNQYVVTENLAVNPNIGEGGRSEGQALSFDLSEGTCLFQITNTYNPNNLEMLRIGQYYKVQIAFIDLNGTIGYWSTVATIKCVAKPTLTIANFNRNDINIFTNEIVGEYVQNVTTGDNSEKVYSYSFQIYEPDGVTIRDESGTLLHNSSKDINSNSSTDTYYFERDLDEDEIYYIEYTVTTINGLKVSSPLYQIMNIVSIPPEEDLVIQVYNGLEASYANKEGWKPCEDGVIKIYLDFKDELDLPLNKKVKTLIGSFVILRSSSKDNFQRWQEIRRFRINGIKPSEKIIYDYTVEQGITYRYAFQQFNRQGFYSRKIYCARDIKAEFEDMFLYDGERQLKIRFNPQVSSFKNDLQEQKIDTIGSKHPFIFRNGNVCYKEFPIAGLISFQTDEGLFFIDNDDFSQMELNRFEIPSKERQYRFRPKYEYVEYSKYPTTKDLPLYIKDNKKVKNKNIINGHEILLSNEEEDFKEIPFYKEITDAQEARLLWSQQEKLYIKKSLDKYSDIYRDETYSKTDLTSENITSERYFKLAILDWLTDGKPKLFRSPTEGNYIIRLLNVSLSPEKALGRMLHNFTCTAYEVADFNHDNLIDLKLLKVDDFESEEYQWYTSNIIDLFKFPYSFDGEDKYYNVDLNGKELYGFQCTGFAPGDKIKLITTEDSTPLIITIGQTGTYLYKTDIQIISFSICPENGTEDFPRSLLLETKGYTYQKFDMIAAINIHTHMGEQIVGRTDNIFEKTVINTGRDIADSQYSNYLQLNNLRNYWHANNVYINESYDPITIDEKTYNNNWYYIKENEEYHLPLISTSTLDGLRAGRRIPFDEKQQYYKRNFSNPKILTTELIYLHAKRREVIPIFMAPPSGKNQTYRLQQLLSQSSSNSGQDILKFMLTPFGNGYVHYKSISKDYDWQNLYGNLTEEERTQALEVNDLVEFTIAKCELDKFCLFEVYIPRTVDGKVEWYPYSEAKFNNDFYYGIFDPYLYNIESKLNKNKGSVKPGWWYNTEEYDSTFKIEYEEDENKIIENISLQDQIEITLKNIKLPTYLSCGTGVVMELIYRLQYIDYTIEIEDKPVFNQKQIFISEKKNALENITLYRLARYYYLVENILKDKNIDLGDRVNFSLDNRAILKQLATLARKRQIEGMVSYLEQEKILVDSTINQLVSIDKELQSLIGEEYTNNYSFFQDDTIVKAQKNFKLYVNNILQATNPDEILETISYYETNNIYPEDARNSVKKTIAQYANNLAYQENWNFPNIFNKILSTLKNGYEQRDSEINKIGTQYYVSQYIDYLWEQAPLKFFNTVEVPGVSSVFQVKDWVNKKDSSALTKDSILDEDTWNNYFHLDFGELPLLEGPTFGEKKYIISNLDQYTNNENYIEIIEPDEEADDLDEREEEEKPSFNERCKLYDATFNININGINRTGKIIDLIGEELINYNIETNASLVSPSAYEQKWGIAWAEEVPKIIEEEGENPWQQNTTDLFLNNPFQLGYIDIENSQIIVQNLELEKVINSGFNNGYLRNDASSSDILNILNNNTYCRSMPQILKNKLSNIIEIYISSSIRQLYAEAYTFYFYSQEHAQNLSEDQKNFVKNQMIYYYQNIIAKPEWDQVLNIQNSNSLLHQFIEDFEQWRNDYFGSAGKTPEAEESENHLQDLIEIFNTIIRAKNEALSQFSWNMNKIKSLKNNYHISDSDKIKIILWDQKETLFNAYTEVTDLIDNFNRKYNYYLNQINTDAYPDFLVSYLENISIEKGFKQYQYLQEIGKRHGQIINDDHDPLKQEEIILNRWKDFLDILANTYREIEQEGRFN